MKNSIFALFLFATFLFGCISMSSYAQPKLVGSNETKSMEQQAIDNCISLCAKEKSNGVNLSNGPCLSNEIVSDWVCDVAHNPRQDIDNNPTNQCSAFGSGAHHFVEVDENCGFIKKY